MRYLEYHPHEGYLEYHSHEGYLEYLEEIPQIAHGNKKPEKDCHIIKLCFP